MRINFKKVHWLLLLSAYNVVLKMRFPFLQRSKFFMNVFGCLILIFCSKIFSWSFVIIFFSLSLAPCISHWTDNLSCLRETCCNQKTCCNKNDFDSFEPMRATQFNFEHSQSTRGSMCATDHKNMYVWVEVFYESVLNWIYKNKK